VLVRWAPVQALVGALPAVRWLLLMKRAQLRRSRCASAVGTGTLCGRDTGRRTPCGYLAAADATSVAAEGTVLWCIRHGYTVRERH
jgi:hypothetical protein